MDRALQPLIRPESLFFKRTQSVEENAKILSTLIRSNAYKVFLASLESDRAVFSEADWDDYNWFYNQFAAFFNAWNGDSDAFTSPNKIQFVADAGREMERLNSAARKMRARMVPENAEELIQEASDIETGFDRLWRSNEVVRIFEALEFPGDHAELPRRIVEIQKNLEKGIARLEAISSQVGIVQHAREIHMKAAEMRGYLDMIRARYQLLSNRPGVVAPRTLRLQLPAGVASQVRRQ